MSMKKLYILFAAISLIVGCEHDILDEVEFYVNLDENNVYCSGEAITFNFVGNAENIVFYSGEKGHEYKYHDRYSVPSESIEAATLKLKITGQYGTNRDVLDIWVTDKFVGLLGDDEEEDETRVSELAESDMTQDWIEVEYNDKDGEVVIDSDIINLKDNFCIAFHWHPIYDEKQPQRHYKVEGDISLSVKDIGESEIELRELDFTSVMMNEERGAYITGTKEGTIILDDSVFDIYFKGAGAKLFEYALDGWAISRPRPLNKIANDKGITVKNTQNTVTSYQYTWDEPGTYEVAFLVTNANHTGTSQIVKKMNITIIDNFNN